MKRPKIKLFSNSKKEKEKAKIMTELLNATITDEDWENMKRTALLIELEYQLNPLGLIFVKWEDKE